jgi:acetyl-CoA carboxylase biotin carboxyl carrier protein
MAADIKKIKEILKLLEKTSFNEVEWEEADFKIRVKKTPSEALAFLPSPGPGTTARIGSESPHVQTEIPRNLPAPQENKNSEIELTEGRAIIRSPLVGTFYYASSPNAPPFVKVGDIIKPGQVLCIIEAMKLMNEVECDRAGKVVAILMENAHPVEYGEPLFIIQTDINE